MLSIATVFGLSVPGGMGSFGGYSVVLKRVLIRVDFPKPDSPEKKQRKKNTRLSLTSDTLLYSLLTDDHGSELEAFPHTFSVNLVGEIGKPNVAH